MTVFAERVRKLRERRHRSREALSQLCGLPSDTIRRYERDEVNWRKIEIGSVLAIAEEFDVSVDYLIGRTDDPWVNTGKRSPWE